MAGISRVAPPTRVGKASPLTTTKPAAPLGGSPARTRLARTTMAPGTGAPTTKKTAGALGGALGGVMGMKKGGVVKKKK